LRHGAPALLAGPTAWWWNWRATTATLLKNFLHMGIPVLGIDPSDTVAVAAAQKIGVPTLVEFFGERSRKRWSPRVSSADLIIGNNVLAHVPQFNDFIAGIALL
jgi:2-polyprenyl-3-methyl-5-hydroxy-6-metoxy-1,4-benzoquinol methylase